MTKAIFIGLILLAGCEKTPKETVVQITSGDKSPSISGVDGDIYVQSDGQVILIHRSKGEGQ